MFGRNRSNEIPSRTVSGNTVSTVISSQPSFNLKSELPIERCNSRKITRTRSREDDLESNYHQVQPNINNTYKQPVRLSPSVRQQASIRITGQKQYGDSMSQIGANGGSSLHYSPSVLTNYTGVGKNLQSVLHDPCHPAHHNNVFEALSIHSDHLSKSEKTARLISLLKKVQSKQRHWSTGLCNICDSENNKSRHLLFQCILGPVYQGCQAERMGEDFFTGCCMGSLLGIPCTSDLPIISCFSNSAMIGLRTKIRERHNIVGAIFEDWLLYLCCLGSCASVQLYQELDELGYPESWLG